MAVSIEQVDAALLIIADGQSLRHAARELGIPVTTLYDAVYSQQPERYARAREAPQNSTRIRSKRSASPHCVVRLPLTPLVSLSTP